MSYKQLKTFLARNYLITIFISIIVFVLFVVFFKLFSSKSTYVFARVKVGQGLWWASSMKPSIWLARAVKKGDIDYGLLGKPQAQVVDVRYYPAEQSDQYNVFLTLRLKADVDTRTKEIFFKRSPLGVGAPVDLQFPSAQISGTIIAISTSPFADQYVNKIIYLTHRYSSPWEFDNIKIGDVYNDGDETIFEVLDKSIKVYRTGTFFASQSEGDNIDNTILGDQRELLTKAVYVKARLRVKNTPQGYIYGEDTPINVGKNITIKTSLYSFDSYMIAQIE